MRKDRCAGLRMGDRGRLEQAPVSSVEFSAIGGDFDEPGPMACSAHHGPGVVEGIDAEDQIVDEQARQFLGGQLRGPMPRTVVPLVVEARYGHDIDLGGFADVRKPDHVPPRTARHSVNHRANPDLGAGMYLANRDRWVVEEYVGIGCGDQRAVEHDMLMRISDSEAFGIHVPQDCPNDRSRLAHRTRSAKLRMAPVSWSAWRIFCTGTSRTAPLAPSAASAAVTPAAWPIAIVWAIERMLAWASWVAEKHRPAVMTFCASRTISDRSGIPTADSSGR